MRLTRNPADPTPEERSRHDATHLPYRPWCPVCVEARAAEDPHYERTAEERSEGNPQICADYCEIGEDENDTTDKQTCLVTRDKWRKTMLAVIADVKDDGDEKSAKGLRQFISSTGCKRVKLKTDGEPALVEVARKVKEISEVDIIPKNSPKYDPKANGLAERAVREFKEQLRATKIGFERRIKTKINPKSPILHWIVIHAIENINRFLVGADCRTPYYRLHGKDFNGKVIEFGEVVYAKPLKKPIRKRSLKSRATLGVWLGIDGRTGEHRVALKDGGPVVRIRTIIRVPDSDKWSSDSNSKGGCDSQAAKPVQQGAERHEEHARYEGHRPRRRWVHTAREPRPGTERPQSKRLPHHSRNPVEVWLYQRMRRMRSENLWHQASRPYRRVPRTARGEDGNRRNNEGDDQKAESKDCGLQDPNGSHNGESRPGIGGAREAARDARGLASRLRGRHPRQRH